MKYIDAERLREEIKSIEEDARKVRVAEESTMNQKIGADGQVHLCQKLNLLIDSLQKEQPEEPKIEIAEYYYQKGVFEGLSQGSADALKILEEFMKRKADPVIVIKQKEQPEVDLEKPVPADLEEAAKNYAMRDKWTYEHFGDVVMKAVFFGAKWQEEQDKGTIELAEDHAFLAGADWQKEQMMKEAVEIGTAQINWEQDGDRAFPTFDPPAEDLLMPGVISQKFNDGDKVKIIIVKED